jgi:transcriptional regulator with XRE-family HTH domain
VISVYEGCHGQVRDLNTPDVSSLATRLGERLRHLRQARRLSQEQLAELAGVSYKFIGDVERGRGNPTIKWLDAVARGLGVPLTDLIVEEEGPSVVTYPPLSGREYSVVRDARDTLEGLLRRYGKADRLKIPPPKTKARRKT